MFGKKRAGWGQMARGVSGPDAYLRTLTVAAPVWLPLHVAKTFSATVIYHEVLEPNPTSVKNKRHTLTECA